MGSGAALFFAKDFRRLVRQQESGIWERFEVEELYGRTLSVVGYGEIGRAVAQKARAFGVEVIALRRHPEICGGEDPATMRVRDISVEDQAARARLSQ